MPAYQIPPWLEPAAAHGFGALAGEASRAALSAQVQRDKINQDAAQANMEMQARQQELAQQAQAKAESMKQDLIREDQKIQIDKAYKDAEIGLRQQDNELAQKEFQSKTQMAAQRMMSTQNFQKAILPVEKGGEGLTPQDAAMKYMAPNMTPDAVGRMATAPAPFKLGAPVPVEGHPELDALQTTRNSFRLIPKPPVTTTNAPNAIPIQGEDRTVGYWATPPGGGKPRFVPNPKTKTSGLEAMVEAIKAKKAGDSVLPMPKKKSDLEKGKSYQTNKGVAEWDGDKFVVK